MRMFHFKNETVPIAEHYRRNPHEPIRMSPDAPIAHRKPRVVAVGLHRLRSFFNELAPSYADRATVSVLDRGFEEAVSEIREMARQERVDVLVAAGSNGEYLRQRLNIPVCSCVSAASTSCERWVGRVICHRASRS
jgi:hypothetical protein